MKGEPFSLFEGASDDEMEAFWGVVHLVGDSLDHIYVGILKLITWLVISVAICSENSYNILMAAVCKPHLGNNIYIALSLSTNYIGQE